MSLGEMVVVMLVAIIVTKPKDLPIIIKKAQQLKSYFTDIQNQIISHITQDTEIEDSILDNTPEQLNFYLERIINLQGHYEGDYSLKNLKAKHNELIKIKSVHSITTDES